VEDGSGALMKLRMKEAEQCGKINDDKRCGCPLA
jgi:hypothetical protein